jgi:hypothetical protein
LILIYQPHPRFSNSLVLRNTVTLKNVWIHTASSSVVYELWNINSIRECGWYVTINVYTIHKAKIELVSFVIEYGRSLITGVKFEVNLTKWGRGSCFCWSFYLKFFWDILMESNCLIWVKKKISVRRGHRVFPSVCRWLVENVPSELNKYVIDKELQHTDNIIFCVAIVGDSFVLDKIS